MTIHEEDTAFQAAQQRAKIGIEMDEFALAGMEYKAATERLRRQFVAKGHAHKRNVEERLKVLLTLDPQALTMSPEEARMAQEAERGNAAMTRLTETAGFNELSETDKAAQLAEVCRQHPITAVHIAASDKQTFIFAVESIRSLNTP